MNIFYSKNADFLRMVNLVGADQKTELATALQDVRSNHIDNWEAVVSMLPEAVNLGISEDQVAQAAKTLGYEPHGPLASAISDRDPRAVVDICSGRTPHYAEVEVESAGIDM